MKNAREKATGASPFVCLVAGGVGFLLGCLFLFFALEYSKLQCERKFDFVNTNIACADSAPVISKIEYQIFRTGLTAYLEEEKQKGTVEEYAVYFRDLRAGPLFGINDRAVFSPASLLKVPLVLMYLRQEDETPGFLENQPALRFTEPPGSVRSIEERRTTPLGYNLGQAFPPPDEIDEGVAYSIHELLFRVLAYSDNKANDILIQHALSVFGEDGFTTIYRELGLLDADEIGDETITVRSYSSLLRALYNASYVSPELSEQALAWLADSSFTEGLVKGIPEGMPVAHKFGERELSSMNTHQLHDCGIIYYPENPYLLCVMLKGPNVFELPPVIAEVSRRVYEEVDSRRVE